MQSICNYLASPNGTVEIHNNAPGCNSPEEVEVACLTAIEDNITKEEIIIFPNPAITIITIQIKEGIRIEEAIINNHLGQKALVAVPVNNTVDVSGLKPGMYFLEVIKQRKPGWNEDGWWSRQLALGSFGNFVNLPKGCLWQAQIQ